MKIRQHYEKKKSELKPIFLHRLTYIYCCWRFEVVFNQQVSKYDKNMAEMLRQTEEIKQKMIFEKVKLRELEEYFAKIDANQKRQNEEVSILAAFRTRVYRAEMVLYDAARVIQKIAFNSVTQYILSYILT